MAQPIQILTGKVKYTAGQPKDYGHGLRVNIVLTLEDGTEEKLWSFADDHAILSLKKGETVRVVRDSRGLKLVESQDESVSANENNADQIQAETHTEWTPEQKRAIASRIEERAKLMKYCLTQAREHCGEYLESSEDLRAIATTLFLEALKH
jgi:hypothetical protein